MNIGIVGSRSRNSKLDEIIIVRTFLVIYEACLNSKLKIKIVSGGCKKGADNVAEKIADLFNIPKLIHLPDESQLDPEKLKKSTAWAWREINFARNTLIARDSDILVACYDGKSNGTKDTMDKYTEMGKKKLIVI